MFFGSKLMYNTFHFELAFKRYEISKFYAFSGISGKQRKRERLLSPKQQLATTAVTRGQGLTGR
jgi:hypothetical protein